jgi:hypothetical protein
VSTAQNSNNAPRRPQLYNADYQGPSPNRTQSPEPIDANASVALGVGQNVLPVTTSPAKQKQAPQADESDPIALALAELKGVTLGKQSSLRMSADHYHGIATPAPGSEASMSRSVPAPGSRDAAAVSRGTPPPSYQQGPQSQVSRLGVPPPAVTSKAMQAATKKATEQTRSMFGEHGRGDAGSYSTSPSSRPRVRGNDMPRATSPAPTRNSASPQPQSSHGSRRMDHRSASPNPYHSTQQHNSSHGSMGSKRGSDQGFYRQPSPNESARAVSPAPYREHQRPQSSYGSSDMAVQLAPVDNDQYGSQRGRGSGRPESRAMGLYNGDTRQRSKSVADPSRQYTRDGRPILHYGRSIVHWRTETLLTVHCSTGAVHVPGSYSRGTRLWEGRLPCSSSSSR